MSRSNLLCSNGGLELLPETCLQVIELLFVSDPKSIDYLQLVSKSLRSLLKTYERSVIKAVAKKFHDLSFMSYQRYITPSRSHLKDSRLIRHTFPWLAEMHHRKATLNYLMNHELTDMAETIHGWPALEDDKQRLENHNINRFKAKAIGLLYGLADCATDLSRTQEIRHKQSSFLQKLSITDLACLGVIVEVIGHNFYNIAKRSRLKVGCISVAPGPHDYESTFKADPISDFTRTGVADEPLTDENWTNELMCVFEDLTQRHGPYFAWAYFEGSKEVLHRPDKWAMERMQEGLRNMYAFEVGYTMAYASLQSVVWRVFRRKIGCSTKESWPMARLLVERAMSAKAAWPSHNTTSLISMELVSI